MTTVHIHTADHSAFWFILQLHTHSLHDSDWNVKQNSLDNNLQGKRAEHIPHYFYKNCAF